MKKYFKKLFGRFFPERGRSGFPKASPEELKEFRMATKKIFNPGSCSDPDLHVVIGRYDSCDDGWYYWQSDGSWIHMFEPSDGRLERMREAKRKNPDLIYGQLPKTVARFSTKEEAFKYWNEFKVKDGRGRVEDSQIAYIPVAEYYHKSEVVND